MQDGDERLRRRQAEIAAIKQGLAEITRDVATFQREVPALILSELRKSGYNPSEPRVPKVIRMAGGGRGRSWPKETIRKLFRMPHLAICGYREPDMGPTKRTIVQMTISPRNNCANRLMQRALRISEEIRPCPPKNI